MDPHKLTKNVIQQISESLVNRRVSDVMDISATKNKGDVGLAIETQVFNLANNSRHEADFIGAGVELKVIPLKQLKNGNLVPKERLVLSMINYFEDYKYTFETSSVYNKTQLMQIIQYNHDYQNKFNSIIVNAFQYSFPQADMEIFKRDYDLISNKIKEGRAHELSEGDTLYLGACTKGAGNGRDFVKQPFSEIPAKSRAFSLKASYLKLINERKRITNEAIFTFAELSAASYDFERALQFKLSKFIGKPLDELIAKFGINKDSKNAVPSLISKMLNIKGKIQESEEFTKANIKVKTIRIVNGKPKEDMSFPAIDFDEIVKTEWADYSLRDAFETQKFAFVIFSGETVDDLKFEGIKIWNMPERDIDEFGAIYNDTKMKCQTNGMVKIENGKYRNEFLKSSQTRIGHIRPHALNSKDVIKLPSGEVLPKQSFWFNKKYIMEMLKK